MRRVIGEELRRLRQARGLTLRELSRRSGIDASNLSGIETGKRDPQISTVEKLAAELGAIVTLRARDPLA